MYNKKLVYEKTLEYFKGDELSANVWINKYALKDIDGNILEITPDDMHKRIAKEFARIEKNYLNSLSEEEIYNLLKDFKYLIPAGSPMAGIGNENQKTSLSNCFVIGTDYDSYGSIMKMDEELVQIMKRRGGVGIDISHLRPSNSPVNNSALTSSGAITFMERYSNSTREVGQDGRRGALMLTMDIRHPSIKEFIDSKIDIIKITGANISIKVNNEFMNAVKNNSNFTLKFPISLNKPKIVEEINALELWNKIIESAWKSAEPGVLFWDISLEESPADCYSSYGFKSVATNPCITGDMNISTNKGNILMKDLYERVLNGELFEVNTFNTQTGIIEFKQVNAAYLTRNKANVIKIELEDGTFIKVTPDHKIYTENRGWVCAAQLNEDDILIKI